jgi:hypothetical protein
MTVELIGVIAFVTGLISIFRPPTFIIYTFACSTLLGAAAAFNLDSLGGQSISPAHLLLCFLIFRLLIERDIRAKALEMIELGRPGFWLMLTVILSLFTAFFMPRLFQGQTFVYAVRATMGGVVPLEPATSNLTQSIYFIADATCFVVMSGYVATRGGIKVMLNVVLVVATTNLVFAVLDLLTYFTNTVIIFSFIRNANYNMLVDTELAGFKRIVGSFVEASSFGATTLGYFGFIGRLWLLGLYPRLTFALSSLSLCATLLATSTTAYVGLAALLAFTYLELVIRAVVRPLTFQMRVFLFGAPLLLAIVVIAIALDDSYSAYIQNLLDTFLFNKLSSASGEERSAWNRQALQSFFDTFGFGFGNGSGRASSFPIAALASLGLFGTVPFCIFFIGLFFASSRGATLDPIDGAARQGAKYMCLAWLISGTISAPMIDLGPAFYFWAALACTTGAQRYTRSLELLSPSANPYPSMHTIDPPSRIQG